MGLRVGAVAVAGVLSFLALRCDVGEKQGGKAAQQAMAGGKEIYAAYCATCHGEKGAGDGPAAEFLFPGPRDFTKGSFKLRSTIGMPTDADLDRTIVRGIPGAAMPSFEFLTPEQRKELIAYLKGFAVVEDDEGVKVNLFEARGPGRVVTVAAPPPRTEKLVHEGKALYEKMQCFKCHGETGTGDGPSAPTLVDNWNRPIPPADFTRGIFKGGGEVSDIYLRFTTGMSGTPMPSFAGELSDQERWALSYYVQSMVRPGVRTLTQASHQQVRAVRAPGSIPLDPTAEMWAGAPEVVFPMMTLRQRPVAPGHVAVRALHSDSHVAFRIEWEDPTVDGAATELDKFSDAAGVMFALSDPPGHFTMGEKERPANIWQWRFSRQIEAAEATARGGVRGEIGEHYVRPAAGTVSKPVPTSAVEDLSAVGFGTVVPQPQTDQDVEGRGVWKDGRWSVVFRRPLKGTGQDAAFAKGEKVSLAVAVWDGFSGDRDGIKSVTYWQILALD